MSMRIGYGFDSHSFKPGVPLIIGGLPIEHPEGLAGHSDGDVLLHAITDALLGAGRGRCRTRACLHSLSHTCFARVARRG